ncbi:hypothetical protein NBRC116188_23190 [Oceaniserpentilla sp. 4NH20-0058]|uniref:cysteine-rich CWC family protein n=1 Tax=Oceaniserpentilla sp. 4NH20-0058 TaxID=3127660 RepID=UPI003103DF0A
MINKPIVDPLLCPLCQQQNKCANLDVADTENPCWCEDSNIQFPNELLAQVPIPKRGKACICQSCAQNFAQTGTVNMFDPKKS